MKNYLHRVKQMNTRIFHKPELKQDQIKKIESPSF